MFDYQEFNNALYASLAGNQNYCNYVAEEPNRNSSNRFNNALYASLAGKQNYYNYVAEEPYRYSSNINEAKYRTMQEDIQKFMARRNYKKYSN